MQGLKLIRQVVYPGIKAGKKDWICRDCDQLERLFMPGLKQRECESRNIITCRGKIVYPGIEAGRKCSLYGLKVARKIADAWA